MTHFSSPDIIPRYLTICHHPRLFSLISNETMLDYNPTYIHVLLHHTYTRTHLCVYRLFRSVKHTNLCVCLYVYAFYRATFIKHSYHIFATNIMPKKQRTEWWFHTWKMSLLCLYTKDTSFMHGDNVINDGKRRCFFLCWVYSSLLYPLRF